MMESKYKEKETIFYAMAYPGGQVVGAGGGSSLPQHRQQKGLSEEVLETLIKPTESWSVFSIIAP